MTATMLKPSTRVWNDQQNDVLNHISRRRGHLRVEANAGTGKTTTTEESIHRLPGDDLSGVLSLAFNKHIAESMKPRMPRGSVASTIHGACYKAAYAAYQPRNPRRWVNSWKYSDIVKKQFETAKIEAKTWKEAKDWQETVVDVLGLCQMTLSSPTVQSVKAIMERHGMKCDLSLERMAGIIEKSLKQGVREAHTHVDFNDMVWLCATGEVDLPKYANLFVDEAQDLNAAQQAVVISMLDAEAQLTYIGDSNQAIYGFSGADTEGMDTLQRRLGAHTLPLSVCYRCPSSHVRLAQSIVPAIQAAPGAKEGILETMGQASVYRKLDWKGGDMWICRTTAPLITQCLNLISNDIPATVLGRDIGKSLCKIVDGLASQDGFSFGCLLEYLEDFRLKSVITLQSEGRNEMAVASIMDRCDSVAHVYKRGRVVKNIRDVDGLNKYINSLFKQDREEGMVTLSTVHKAKGLEADRVFVLRPDLMPHSKAVSDWEKQQEANLQYIAWTRSKHSLYFVVDEAGDDEEAVL
jgi:DNA helicase-2/ATP-dependent DNA helicase PcrA